MKPRLEPPRPAGPVLGLFASLAAAGALMAIATADSWLGPAASLDLPRAGTLGALLLLCSVALVWILRTAHKGRRRRVLLTALGMLVLFVAGIKAALVYLPVPAYGAPVAVLGILGAAVVGRGAGVALAAAGAFAVTCLGPPDAALAVVLFAQGAGGALAVPLRPKRGGSLIVAGLGGAACAAATYATVAALKTVEIPMAELAHPLASPWFWSTAGGLAGGILAALAQGLVERAIGELPRSTLVELADLEHPLLKRIATEAPGTWQHSLAMANFAEIAANAIGANALLVRVGAYFHDLGKSLQPPYYIENLGAGQKSPHDALPPETSADAIFAHVTEGVRLARENGLPERIIDFMHMHHGDSVLEYFWGRCQEQGNPMGLSQDAFRYPGVRPQSKETAILALCDAVEAGSRTLPRGDGKAIEALVARIVTVKLRQGQLDESGLTLAELRTLHETLVSTLMHANHARIEYPWQREARAEQTQNLRKDAVAVAVTQEVSSPKRKAKIVSADTDDIGRKLREDE